VLVHCVQDDRAGLHGQHEVSEVAILSVVMFDQERVHGHALRLDHERRSQLIAVETSDRLIGSPWTEQRETSLNIGDHVRQPVEFDGVAVNVHVQLSGGSRIRYEGHPCAVPRHAVLVDHPSGGHEGDDAGRIGQHGGRRAPCGRILRKRRQGLKRLSRVNRFRQHRRRPGAVGRDARDPRRRL
jgi:hypothetical protein